MQKADSGIVRRIFATVVLLFGIFYMPGVRRRLIISMEGVYDWIDSPMNNSTAKALEIFDSAKLFSIALILIVSALILLFRRNKGMKTVFLLAGGIAVYAVGLVIFAISKGADAALMPYIFEQGACSAALGAGIFLFLK